MSVFTEREITYLNEQRLGRLATVGANTQPHVVPVGFRYDADDDAIHIGGRNLSETKKFRDVEHDPHVAFVVDDLASIDPWRPRGIEIRGRARTFGEGGERFGPGFGAAWIRITPKRIISWGVSGDSDGTATGRTV
ncbi:PPOX class F420-dependent oxidoreductase [Haladaptatus caseinilyticus]|uniref:PPOX class F420-dependent oxidoreductase n=1 Tax=Haladaptatus caseinilyticus TaxID=2993314 RepID=UPI00224B6431|nr:PPOX class F420-dependent oxidoreductase [Haladaptatus caseinilyticus]